MLTHGFEWTLQRGEPSNPAPLRFKWHQPCCKLRLDEHGRIACGHAWNVSLHFPRGDPINGREWEREGEDPGLFDGGTLFEGEPPG
jgi:hypothetical protein